MGFVDESIFDLSIEPDKSAAYLWVDNSDEDIEALFEQALQVISRAGIKYGVNQKAVREAVGTDRGKRIQVAQGKPVKMGVDGRVFYHYLPEGQESGRPQEREDGSVDFLNLNLVHNVRNGDLLATKMPPIIGEPGMTITGQILRATPGKNVNLRRGKNTLLNEEGTKLFATCDGHVVLSSDGTINVQPVYEISGDVDITTGNLTFVGSIVIRGSIKSGLSVKADGDVEIYGNVEGGSVYAGGSIEVRRGIIGGQGNKNSVVAGGWIKAMFIENGIVKADGDVLIQDAILNSQVRSGGRIQVEGRRGTIVGGVTQAIQEIHAKTIGSPLTPPTVIEVGIQPEAKDRVKELNQEISERRQNLQKIQQTITLFRNTHGNATTMSDENKAILERLRNTEKQISEEIEALQKDRDALEEKILALRKGKIRVKDVIYPGVGVTIGMLNMKVNDPIQFCKLLIEDEVIKIYPYN